MSESEEGRSLSISEARLWRVTEAIALATAEAFDEAISHLGEEVSDELGLIEHGLRLFLAELRDAKIRGNRAMDGLTAAKKELEGKLATIERQDAAIRELSAPILEIWEGVLSLPVVGAVTAARAMDMADRLLRRVVEVRAKWVLLDLTGVGDVDEATADHLIRLAKAVRLIGCRCILTGIQPHVAHTLVTIGADLGELHPVRSLGEGLRYCLEERANGRG